MDSEATDQPSDETETEARPLNRAERRAQEHHKKTQNSAVPGIGTGRSGSSAMPTGKPVKRAGDVKLPRTGHK